MNAFWHLPGSTCREWSASRGNMRDFYTFRGSSKSCQPRTSGELWPFAMDRFKGLKKIYDVANVTRILLLAPAQDSGVPHKTFGPPCHIEQPDQHAHTKPGSGLGSKPATVCASLTLCLKLQLMQTLMQREISSCKCYVGGIKNSWQSVDVIFSDLKILRHCQVTETWPSRRCEYSSQWSSSF